ncbi:HAMP domain-containing sensor histidine kinase [Tunturiibacter empetritectus]|uniref:histidine kinase n=2 Tax=Tunturiibacter TaxID=3154218 RepID=A0A852V5U3_9BACT|nr:HAMP domain-containing sensor histidine kinase [Edaphobacter lichenicola]NYF88388.1 signal transduction histidine kinase [Edaphobacter lichenicola]
MKSYSLTRRLIAAVLLVELCSLLALIGIASVYEGISHFRAFDVTLRGRVDSVLGAVQDAEDPEDNLMLYGTEGLAPRRDIYIVRDDRGRVIGSQGWPGGEQELASKDTREFRNLTVGGIHYRVIRRPGLRIVDPGDAKGGIARHVIILYGSRTHPVWERVRNAIAFYALSGLLLLMITGVVLLHLLRSGLQPLYELVEQAGKISVNSWNLGPSSQARYVRELEPLVSAIESALLRLEQSFAQQKQFVSDAAHELKTSVAVVKSSFQLLTMRSRSAKEYEEGLERVRIDSERMEELVAKMLTLARLEDGAEQPESYRMVELGDVLRDVAEHFRTLASFHRINLVINAERPVFVSCDPDQVRLLCSNLIHNAIQHSGEGAEVRAIVTSRDSVARLVIEDDGIGVPEEVLPHVFDRFYRGDPSRSRRTGGTGLGLAISKAIVLRYHGAISLESRPGQGTSAIVTLPLVQIATEKTYPGTASSREKGVPTS